jgi:hypothetical protein
MVSRLWAASRQLPKRFFLKKKLPKRFLYVHVAFESQSNLLERASHVLSRLGNHGRSFQNLSGIGFLGWFSGPTIRPRSVGTGLKRGGPEWSYLQWIQSRSNPGRREKKRTSPVASASVRTRRAEGGEKKRKIRISARQGHVLQHGKGATCWFAARTRCRSARPGSRGPDDEEGSRTRKKKAEGKAGRLARIAWPLREHVRCTPSRFGQAGWFVPFSTYVKSCF